MNVELLNDVIVPAKAACYVGGGAAIQFEPAGLS
jgi:hypothetical protein